MLMLNGTWINGAFSWSHLLRGYDKASARPVLLFSLTASPETQRRLTGLMAKVKEGAEKAKEELENAKREIEKRAGALDGVVGANGRKDSAGWFNKSNVYINLSSSDVSFPVKLTGICFSD